MWDTGCEEPWLLISDQGAGRRQVQVYAWRMRVEATFQDSKSRGWNIEASWIVDRTHLDRLLLALFLAMWWVSHLAAACIHHGQRQRFDRVDRRDKSIFRLGRLWLLDILRRVHNRASLRHCLPFQKMKTGGALPYASNIEGRLGIVKRVLLPACSKVSGREGKGTVLHTVCLL